jgi:hypothetical protein
MSIDNLFRQLTDIQFQADKILKAKKIEEDVIARFADYSNELKSGLIDLDLNEELSIHVNDIEPIDILVDPKPPIMVKLIGALSFGVASKKYRKRKREEYFRSLVKNTRDQYSCIRNLLHEI